MNKIGLKTSMIIGTVLAVIAVISEIMVYTGIDSSTVGKDIFFISLIVADTWWVLLVIMLIQKRMSCAKG